MRIDLYIGFCLLDTDDSSLDIDEKIIFNYIIIMLKKITKVKSNSRDRKIFSDYDSYVCIPMAIDKKPAISWKDIKKTPKSKFLPEHNIAILTGQINQITVIDIDLEKMYL